ncbi:MAG: glycosyl transferase [Deltaproteobacteria bacterium RBG_16_42_7]|nr:MAG: glycosyl transferase [Deltaproteobacteria bacterium RBG_16_42_7]
MKVIILNTYDIQGGAARAAYRLHKGLEEIGVDSRMLVQYKFGDDPTVSGPATKFAKGLALMRPMLDALMVELYRNRSHVIFSPAVLPSGVRKKVSTMDPDIIHMQWVAGGFLRIETLGRFKKPLVWTLQDSWPFTGGCHIPFDCTRYRSDCGRCPILGSSRECDLSRMIWKRKKKTLRKLNLTIVTPSRWMAGCARSSSLLGDFRIEVIPNGLDVNFFRPKHKATAREFLSLPQDKKLIIFGAVNSTSDRNKGFHLLLQALRELSRTGLAEKTELVVFGASEPADAAAFGIKAHYMGRSIDDFTISTLYAASDVFVMPSIQDNFPNTVLEAFACGVPVVAFDAAGAPDMVEHQINGYLARPFDTKDFAQGIAWILTDPERTEKLGMAARDKAVKQYSVDLQAKRYLNLYEEILARKRI